MSDDQRRASLAGAGRSHAAEPPTRFRYLIIALLFMIAVVNYVDRGALSYTSEQVIAEYGFSKANWGADLGRVAAPDRRLANDVHRSRHQQPRPAVHLCVDLHRPARSMCPGECRRARQDYAVDGSVGGANRRGRRPAVLVQLFLQPHPDLQRRRLFRLPLYYVPVAHLDAKISAGPVPLQSFIALVRGD